MCLLKGFKVRRWENSSAKICLGFSVGFYGDRISPSGVRPCKQVFLGVAFEVGASLLLYLHPIWSSPSPVSWCLLPGASSRLGFASKQRSMGEMRLREGRSIVPGVFSRAGGVAALNSVRLR